MNATGSNATIETEDGINEYTIWSYTDAQSISLCLVSTLSGFLSMFGSGSIVYSVVVRSGRRRLYERMVAAVSVADLLATLSFSIGVYMVPSSTGMAMAWGNTASCSLASFFFQYYCAVSMTCCNLAIYFYCSVCRGWSDEYFSKHYERVLLTIAFAAPTALAVGVAVTESGNPNAVGHFCTMETYPPKCNAVLENVVECKRGGEQGEWVALWYDVLLVLSFAPTVVALIATALVAQAVIRSTHRASIAGSDAAVRRQHRTMWQALYYFMAYMAFFVWPIILGFASEEVLPSEVHEPGLFARAFLAHALIPMQGLFNYLIFRRQRCNFCHCRCFLSCHDWPKSRHRNTASKIDSDSTEPNNQPTTRAYRLLGLVTTRPCGIQAQPESKPESQPQQQYQQPEPHQDKSARSETRSLSSLRMAHVGDKMPTSRNRCDDIDELEQSKDSQVH